MFQCPQESNLWFRCSALTNWATAAGCRDIELSCNILNYWCWNLLQYFIHLFVICCFMRLYVCADICPAFPISLTQFCCIYRVYLLSTLLALEGEAESYLKSVNKEQLNAPLRLSFAYMKRGKYLRACSFLLLHFKTLFKRPAFMCRPNANELYINS
jgi:hypothetical protein